MTDVTGCIVIENEALCTDKRDTFWELESPELGMVFRIGLCATHKTKIQLAGAISEQLEEVGIESNIHVESRKPAALRCMCLVKSGGPLIGELTCMCTHPAHADLCSAVL